MLQGVNPWIAVIGAATVAAVFFETAPQAGSYFLILVVLAMLIYGYNTGWGQNAPNLSQNVGLGVF